MRVCSVCQRCYDDLEFSCVIETHPTPAEFRPGYTEMIAGFRLDRVLEAENRRETYLAKHLDSGHECVVNIYKGSEPLAEAFAVEAGAVKALFHPNIADVYEAGLLSDGEYFVVSEAIDGQTFSDLLRTRGIPDLLQAITLVRQAAEALHAIHLKGILHRAISSDNIVITKDIDGRDTVKLIGIDLGGAQQHSMVADKFSIDSAVDRLRYFAPELFGGEAATLKSDIYSLGVVFYEMLAGRTPFNASTASGLVEMHRNARPADIRIDDFELRMLITHTLTESLRKRPEKRQTSANAFARQLRHIEQLSTNVSTPPPAIQVTEPPRKVPVKVETSVAAAEPISMPPLPVVEVAVPMIQPESISQPVMVRPAEKDQPRLVRRKKRHTAVTHVEEVKIESPLAAMQRSEEAFPAVAAVSDSPVPRKKVVLQELEDDIPTVADLVDELSKESAAKSSVVAQEEPVQQPTSIAIPPEKQELIPTPAPEQPPAAADELPTAPVPVSRPTAAPQTKKKPKRPAAMAPDAEEITARPVRIRVPIEKPRKERRPAFARAAFSNSANDTVFFPTMLGSSRTDDERADSDGGGMMSAFYSAGSASKMVQYRSYVVGGAAVALIAIVFWASGSLTQDPLTAEANETATAPRVLTQQPQEQQPLTASPVSMKMAAIKPTEKPQPVSSSLPSTVAKPKEEKVEKNSADKTRPASEKKTEKPKTDTSRPTETKRAVVKKQSTTTASKPTGSTRPRIVLNGKQ